MLKALDISNDFDEKDLIVPFEIVKINLKKIDTAN
jgi:hypothetical protein